MNRYVITRDKFMSVKETKKLMKVCKRKAAADLQEKRSTWINRYMLVHLALHSGLRVSEVAALKIGDLHFNGKENYLIVQCGKRGRKRDVYIDSEIVMHLQNYVIIKKDLWKEPIDNDSPLFTGRGGNHFTTTALEISFKKAMEEAGLPKTYSIHSLRHTYATFLLAKSKNIRFVQKQLGHASMSMTCLYADVLPDMNQKLAEAMLKY
jgi:site-specific recombinase XerD